MNNKILIIILFLFIICLVILKEKYYKIYLRCVLYIESYINRINILFMYYISNLNKNNSIIENKILLSKYYFVSFGGPTKNYYDALDSIYKQVNNLQIFDYNIKYTDIDLQNDIKFWQRHSKFIKNNKRGYGYWIWKPYIILQTLNKMQDNDILLYADAGCEIINNSQKMEYLLKKCDEYNILYSSTYFNEINWTKRDLLNYMDMDCPIYINSLQSQASFIFIKKNDKMYNFVKEWYNIASNNYNFIDDSPSILPNYKIFIENRHDQSIFSLLTKKYDVNNNNNILVDHYPIIIAKNR